MAETPSGENAAEQGHEHPAASDSRRYLYYVPVILAGVIVAVILWSVVPVGGQAGTVAVVPVEGSIDGSTAVTVGTALEEAAADPSVQAVVLLVNSPGGTASASESMYLQARRTAESLPVVASVDAQAASGAYYTILPSDAIYVKPSSTVGSVGVLFTPPPSVEPTDDIIATGPNKLTGADQRGWYYKTEALQSAFLSAVMSNRGEDLSLSRQQVATGTVFTGARAVENGLADAIGGVQTAVDRAASMAGLNDYDVRVIRPADATRFITRSNYLASNASNKTMSSATYLLGAPETRFPNFLMVPSSIVETALVHRSVPSNVSRTAEVANASG